MRRILFAAILWLLPFMACAQVQQLTPTALTFTSSSVSTGSANTQVVTSVGNNFSLAIGNSITFVPGFTSSGTATVNVDGTGATQVNLNGAAAPSGSLVLNRGITLVYDGTNFDIPQSGVLNANIGVATGTSLALGGCTITSYALCATGNANVNGTLTLGASGTGALFFGTAEMLTPVGGGGVELLTPAVSAASTPAGDIYVAAGNATGTGGPSNGGSLRFSSGTSTNGTAGAYFFLGIPSSSAGTTGTLCWTTGTGAVTVDTTTTCLASSRRFKQDITPFAPAPSYRSALDEVLALRPITFRYKPDFAQGDPGLSAIQPGFIAEELNAVDPRLVAFDSDGVTPRGARYQEMVAVLTAAIKDQQAEIERLKQARHGWHWPWE